MRHERLAETTDDNDVLSKRAQTSGGRYQRVRIQDTCITAYPDFAGCVDWTKPLIFFDFQVKSSTFLCLLMKIFKNFGKMSVELFSDGTIEGVALLHLLQSH
jgi:hypothetical protein